MEEGGAIAALMAMLAGMMFILVAPRKLRACAESQRACEGSKPSSSKTCTAGIAVTSGRPPWD